MFLLLVINARAIGKLEINQFHVVDSLVKLYIGSVEQKLKSNHLKKGPSNITLVYFSEIIIKDSTLTSFKFCVRNINLFKYLYRFKPQVKYYRIEGDHYVLFAFNSNIDTSIVDSFSSLGKKYDRDQVCFHRYLEHLQRKSGYKGQTKPLIIDGFESRNGVSTEVWRKYKYKECDNRILFYNKLNNATEITIISKWEQLNEMQYNDSWLSVLMDYDRIELDWPAIKKSLFEMDFLFE